MSKQLPGRIWIVSSTLFVLLALGCSVLSQLRPGSEVKVQPTRTPLPTFTATTIAQQPGPLVPTPTETALPLPSPDLPTATLTPLPAATPVPEPAATATPAPPPTSEPPPPPPPPPPTEPPPPPAVVAGQNGIIGKIAFRDGRNAFAVGEKVFVNIEATTESGAGQVSFGILGLTTSTGAFQTSWSNGTVNGTFRHEDGIPFNAPGNHKLWLSICFSALDVCQGPDGNWERFEPGLDVIVQ